MADDKSKVYVAKRAAPPPALPVYGKVKPEEVSFLGRTNYETALESKKYVFGIKRKDRRRHIYIIGKSGVGKSKSLELLIRQDVYYNHGLCIIDPHGDLIDATLDFIPEERIDDVVIIDPADVNYPISFNPLEKVPDEFKHMMAQDLIEIMSKQFGANWTPRLEHVFRFTTLALLDYPEATLQGMILMLTDRNYRQKVISYIQNDMVKRFFAVEFADWSEKFDTEAIIPLVNKLGQFLSIPLLRNIFAQKENKIDFKQIMDEGKILLINLSKGKIGEENASFFGSMFITKIKQAGMARATMPEEQRRDFYLYVDEFYNVMTESFLNLFAEARKYGLCITVVHQYVSQLLPSVLAAVLGNVGTIISFRIGGEDAQRLETELTPTFTAKDMINLGRREFYIKLIIDGESYDPFSAETLIIKKPPHPSYKDKIIEASRNKYAVPLDKVKEMLSGDLGLSEEESSTSSQSQSASTQNNADQGSEEESEEEQPLI